MFKNILRRTLDRRGAVSLLFATAVIPLLMMVGLAVDFGLYTQAQSQLDMAADAASIHAARVAAQLQMQNDPDFLTKGQSAGVAWFASQLGVIPQSKEIDPPIIQMSFDASNASVTAKVTYSGVILAHFGNLFPNNWPHWPNWGIAGGATAVITNPAYVEVLMLLDNSSSMLIGADVTNIDRMDQLTPCSMQSKNEGQDIDTDYSWAYVPEADGTWLWNPLPSTLSNQTPVDNPNVKLPYGFGQLIYTNTSNVLTYTNDVVPTAAQIGNCDFRYTGAAQCYYPGSLPGLTSTGHCANGGGGKGSLAPPGTGKPPKFVQLETMPQAPCAFACHDHPGHDYWSLAKKNGIVTRYTVLHQAAGRIIRDMTKAPSPSQLSIGVYQYTEPKLLSSTDPGVSVVYPNNGAEAGPVLGGSDGNDPASLTANIDPPVTTDRADTHFEPAIDYVNSIVSAAGTGQNPSTPKKNIFIVTDGMDDYYPNDDASQPQTRVNSPIDPSHCNALKAKGFKIYVLYTQYYPLPNPFYLENDKIYAEIPVGASTSPIETAMAACSSNDPNDPNNPNDYFYEAGDTKSINNALDSMLAAALGSAGRLTN